VSQQEYGCQADAEAAAATLRAPQSAYHAVEVRVEAHPQSGPGRPSQQQPRVSTALRYGVQVTRRERAEVIARRPQATGCVGLLTQVPPVDARAQRAGDVLRAYTAPQGIEQNFGFVTDPRIVKSLLLKKPERIAALGLGLWLAWRRWRLVERTRRGHVETTKTPLRGWDTKATQKPPAFMMMTTFAGVLVLKVEDQRQFVHPLSTVQQQYLRALGVPATYCTVPQRGHRDETGKSRSQPSPG